MASFQGRLSLRRCRAGLSQGLMLLSGCLLLPAQAHAEPDIRITKRHYTIEGNSADAIRADIRQKSPVRHNGKRHVARTDWHVSWRFWMSNSGHSCEMGVRAAVEIENRISGMGASDSCSRLEGDANRMARDVIDKYVRLEKEYDRTTNHGINTGAVFH